MRRCSMLTLYICLILYIQIDDVAFDVQPNRQFADEEKALMSFQSIRWLNASDSFELISQKAQINKTTSWTLNVKWKRRPNNVRMNDEMPDWMADCER